MNNSLKSKRSLTSRCLALVGGSLLSVTLQSAQAADDALTLYKQCQAKPSTAEQRECFPAVIKQSEIELAAAEKAARAEMVELEEISPASRELHPVLNFDNAATAFYAFRDAESQRVLSSFGSGNGGGLAASETIIQMNIARAKTLNGQAEQ